MPIHMKIRNGAIALPKMPRWWIQVIYFILVNRLKWTTNTSAMKHVTDAVHMSGGDPVSSLST